MIFVPNDIKIRAGIEQGSVYNFSPDKSVPNHYFIVLNKNPKKDSEIYLASFTSKKDNVIRFVNNSSCDPRTCVEVITGECPFLPRESESCVNCNQTRKYNIQKLVELVDTTNGSCYPKISESLMTRIIEGVKLSRLVASDIRTAL
jgi:hypothetical protein